jgi:hypothetical protein
VNVNAVFTSSLYYISTSKGGERNMQRAAIVAIFSLVISFFVAVTVVSAQTTTTSPTVSPSAAPTTAQQNTPGAPSTGF